MIIYICGGHNIENKGYQIFFKAPFMQYSFAMSHPPKNPVKMFISHFTTEAPGAESNPESQGLRKL